MSRWWREKVSKHGKEYMAVRSPSLEDMAPALLCPEADFVFRPASSGDAIYVDDDSVPKRRFLILFCSKKSRKNETMVIERALYPQIGDIERVIGDNAFLLAISEILE